MNTHSKEENVIHISQLRPRVAYPRKTGHKDAFWEIKNGAGGVKTRIPKGFKAVASITRRMCLAREPNQSINALILKGRTGVRYHSRLSDR